MTIIRDDDLPTAVKTALVVTVDHAALSAALAAVTPPKFRHALGRIPTHSGGIMNVEVTVTLWETDAGNLALTRDLDAGGVAFLALGEGAWIMDGRADPGEFLRDADALCAGDITNWTIEQLPRRTIASDDRWRCIAEWDGSILTALDDRVGGAQPGNAAARYLGFDLPALVADKLARDPRRIPGRRIPTPATEVEDL